MSERYKQVKLYDNFKFCPTCPVDILKGAIYIDTTTNKAVFQLKFINMQDKKIKAIYVSVAGSNDLGQQFQNKEYQYLDLNVNKGQEFGTEQLKELDDNTIRNINVTINKIIYSDNSIWENTNNTYYDRMNIQKVDNNLSVIAKQKVTEQRLQLDEIYYPIQNENYWSCICGTLNSNNNDKCYKCSCCKDYAINNFNQIELKKDLTAYNNQEEAKKEIRKRNLKKLKKIFLACIPIIIILAVAFYFINVEKNKLSIYEKAIGMYNNMQYDECIELLKDIEEYKDSKTYIENANKEKEDLKIINNCVSYYEKQSDYFYEQCKKLGWEIHYNRAEQYINALNLNGYYKIIATTYSLRETYLKQLRELKTDKFEEKKENIIKIDEQYTQLYNYYIESPKYDNYTDYVNGAYKYYNKILDYINQIK